MTVHTLGEAENPIAAQFTRLYVSADPARHCKNSWRATGFPLAHLGNLTRLDSDASGKNITQWQLLHRVGELQKKGR